MSVNPSDDMRGIYEVGIGIAAHDRISASLAPLAADIKQATGGDCAMMGWGILGVAALLTPIADTVGKGARQSDVAAFTVGLTSSLVAATVLGSDLITQGQPAATSVLGTGVRPSLPSGLDGTLPQAVAGAEQTLRAQFIFPSLADPLLDLLAARGDFATKGLLPSLSTELPGLDLAHAGVAQLACGNYFLQGGGHAATVAAMDDTKRGRARRKELATAAARDSGAVVFGALMFLAGDQCLTAAG
jgi:hypothetical protein